MTLMTAAILGLVQGLTEFLPISSSGHLVLAARLFGIEQPGLTFPIVVHLGTLLSVLIVYRRDVLGIVLAFWPGRKIDSDGLVLRRLGWLVVLGSIPAGLAGLLWKDFFEKTFNNPVLVAGLLLVTGLILFSTGWIKRGQRLAGAMGMTDGLLIGIMQACAILPGISRSGLTITAGMWRQLTPATAARYSFLLSIPAILGAAFLDMLDLLATPGGLLMAKAQAGALTVGMATSALAGLLAIVWLLRLLAQGRLSVFAWYCWGVGLTALVWLFLS